MLKRILVCAAVAALASSPASAQKAGQEVAVQWKFAKGEAIRYRQQTGTDVKLSLPVGDQETTTKLVQQFCLTVVDVDAAGIATLGLKVELVQFEMDTKSGTSLKFDSSKEEDRKKAAENERLKPFIELLAAAIEIKVDPSGKILEAKGIAEKSGGVVGILDQGSLKSLLVGFPGGKVAAGSPWGATVPREMAGMSVDAETAWTLSGVEEYKGRECARLESKLKLKVDPAKNPMFKSKKEDAGKAEGSGIVMFGLSEGRVVAQQLKLDVEFLLTGSAGEKQFDMTHKVRSETVTELVPKE